VFYPPADREFLDWIQTLSFENILVRAAGPRGAYGWNVKPHAMLELLNEDNFEILWIDSDVLVTKNVFVAIGELEDTTLVVTEEALQNQDETRAIRARLWGFPVKREFQFPLNSSVMRVTREHASLLARWKELLESPMYQDAQRQPMNMRPRHMFSDQDVLTALLSSEEFHDIPVKILRRGYDIIQYYEQMGFTLAERIICTLRGMPTFLHQQGWKPWLANPDENLKGFWGRTVSAYQDLSPYTTTAIALNSAAIHPWMRARSKLSSVLRAVGFGYPPFTGLPLAVIFDLGRLAGLPRHIIKNIISTLCPGVIDFLRARRAAREVSRQARKQEP